MKYLIQTEKDLENFIKEIKNKKLPFNTEIKSFKNYKTRSQLGFLWGILFQDIAKHFKEEGLTIGDTDQFYEPDDIKTWLYHKIIGTNYKEMPNGDIVPYQKTLKDMSKEECSKFINQVFDVIEDIQIPLRPSVKTLWLNHTQQTIKEELKKQKLPQISKEYLCYQRKQNCLYCGKYPSEPHHIQDTKYCGLSQKTPDWYTIPLCRICHIYLGSFSPQIIEKKLPLYNTNIEKYCKLSYIKWLLKY